MIISPPPSHVIKFFVNLYKSVYWTKRVFVVLGLLLFVCSGVRIFQFITKKFTRTEQFGSTEPLAQLGFGKIDRLTLTPLNTEGFNPTTFADLTLTGKLDVDNKYPSGTVKAPIANVYKIIDKSLSLETREAPRAIAKSLKFTGEPVSNTSSSQKWQEGSKKFEINGQYFWMTYENADLRQKLPINIGPALDIEDENALKEFYSRTMVNLGIGFNTNEYRFQAEYVNYDSAANTYKIVTDPSQTGGFIRVNATRVYSSITTGIADAIAARAVYPNYIYSNNFIIVPTSFSQSSDTADILVQLSFYNWGITQQNNLESQNVQTYDIKTPKQAYTDLVEENKYLMSLTEWNTKKQVDPSVLSGITRVNIHRIRLDMYEDTVNTTYIQPVYVFICKAVKEGKEYELVYYVPAVADKNLQ